MKKLIPLTLLVLMSCGKSTTELNQSPAATTATTTISTESSIIKDSLIKNEVLASSSIVALVDKSGNPFCTGTLISQNLVLTTAHCVSEWTEKSFFRKSKRVTTLTKVRFKLDSSKDVAELDMDAIELYPAKNQKEQWLHDIALVKFTGTFPKEFKPVAILAPEYKLVGNKDLILVDFRFTSRTPYKEAEGDILILNQNNGKEANSGGPAYLESKNELLLTGSTIGGVDGAEIHSIKVSAYKKFILEAAKKLKGALPVFKMPEE